MERISVFHSFSYHLQTVSNYIKSGLWFQIQALSGSISAVLYVLIVLLALGRISQNYSPQRPGFDRMNFLGSFLLFLCAYAVLFMVVSL